MINLYSTQIDSISIHRVGNKNKGEVAFLSEEPTALNDETTGSFKRVFLQTISRKRREITLSFPMR